MELPITTGGPTGPRGGIVGPMSQPLGIINAVSLTLNHPHAFNMHFLRQLYSRQLKVTCTLICRGTESHQARKEITWSDIQQLRVWNYIFYTRH